MALFDRYGRAHDDLRISVTDRCNFRCFYCMPEEGMTWLPHAEVLDYEEIARVVRITTDLGFTSYHLTGGEPLLRKDLHRLVEQMMEIQPDMDLAPHDQRRLSPQDGEGSVRGGFKAREHQPRFHGRGQIPVHDAPRRFRPGDGRHRGGGCGGVLADQDKRGGGQGLERGGIAALRQVVARDGPRRSLHRIHAARCGSHLDAREGADGGRRYWKASPSRENSNW